MKVFDISLIVLMIFGLAFYASCLIYFLKGKIQTDAATQKIAFGSFQLNSSSFIFLAIISALFAFSPVIEKHIPTKHIPETQAGKIEYITYEVQGRATNTDGRIMQGVSVSCQHLRKGKTIFSDTTATEHNGYYSFTFDSVKLEDKILVIWDDPEGSINTREFSPKKAILDLAIENK